jgi:hypothetical protein
MIILGDVEELPGLRVFAELPGTITALWVDGGRLYASTAVGVYEVFQNHIRRIPDHCKHPAFARLT